MDANEIAAERDRLAWNKILELSEQMPDMVPTAIVNAVRALLNKPSLPPAVNTPLNKVPARVLELLGVLGDAPMGVSLGPAPEEPANPDVPAGEIKSGKFTVPLEWINFDRTALDNLVSKARDSFDKEALDSLKDLSARPIYTMGSPDPIAFSKDKAREKVVRKVREMIRQRMREFLATYESSTPQQWREWREEVLSCEHIIDPPFEICAKCGVSQVMIQELAELPDEPAVPMIAGDDAARGEVEYVPAIESDGFMQRDL